MIKRAETKETVEVLDILNLMAGKILAIPVLEKTAGILFHAISFKYDNPRVKDPG